MIRASMIGKLMGTAKSINPDLVTPEIKSIQSKPIAKRSQDEKDLLALLISQTLPDGAITALDEMVSQKLLNWRDEQDFFTLKKGIECENESIELYNEFKDEFYIKNIERVTIGNLTGECDILDVGKDLVIDIKTAYNKKSHPLSLTASKLYEWQLRAYMYLYDVNHAELAYCLVDTPIELRKKSEPDSWHEVADVPMHLRVRTFRIERCLIKEKQMLDRIELSMKYFKEQLELLG